MTSGIFGITLQGLSAAQMNLDVTSQNISNVNTPGYHRQTANQVTGSPLVTSYGTINNGVNSAGVARAYNSFLENQVISSQGQLSSYQGYTQYATQLNSLVGDQNSALASAVSDFFSSIQTVANDPTSAVARQTMLTAGSSLAGQYQNLSTGLGNLAQDVNQDVQSIASQVTSYAKGIAALNVQIATAQASSDASANSLMDQRDQLVAELNKLVNVSVVNQAGSGYTLLIGNGQPLVMGGQANTMTSVSNPADPTQQLPALQIGSGTVTLNSSQIPGGQLGGVLAFRDQMLVPTQSQLGKMAYTLASEVNTVSTQGYDLNGAAGTDFFNTPSIQEPIANQNNTGNGVLSLTITDPNKLANSDYKLSYDGTNYTLTRLSDGTSYSNSSLAALSTTVSSNEGFSLSGTGTINSGDTYLIRPTQYSASGLSVAITDPNKIAAAAEGVTTAASGTNTGTATISQATVSSSASRPLANTPYILTYSSGGGGTITVKDSALPPTTIGTFAYTSGSPISFDGISVTISGTPNNTDSFTVNNNTGISAGPGDNGNALQMADLQSQKLLDGSTNTLQSAFVQLVGQNASLTSEATTNQSSYQTLNDQATQAQQSYSGVNLDQEAANLIQYQQAYQAAAKSLQVASSLFNTILSALQ